MSNAVRQPWQMTRAEWNAERDRLRPDYAQSNFTRASGSEAIARLNRAEWLRFDVRAEDSARMNAAARGEVTLSPDELEALHDRLQSRVTYDDVIARAVCLGLLPAASEEPLAA